MKSKTLIGSMSTIFLLILFGMIFGPSMVRSYLVKNSLELTGRQIEIDKLKFNFFTSTARVYGFEMKEEDGQEVFASFDTLVLNLEPLRYFKDEKAIEKFYIQGLFAQLIMEDSSFNYDDLIEFHLPEDSDQEESDDESVFKYSISNIELNDAHFIFDNRVIGNVTDVPGIDLSIPLISWDQSEKSSADVAFDMRRGGRFQANFDFDPNSGELDANLDVTKLYLDPFYEYARESVELSSLNGTIDFNLGVSGNIYEYEKLIMFLEASVFDLEMKDFDDKLFLGAKQVNLLADKIDYYNTDYHVNKIEVIDSYAYFQLDSASNNFFRIFGLEGEQDSTFNDDPGTSDQMLIYKIDEFVLTNGKLDYSDNLTGEPFNYSLTEIEIDTKDITNDTDWLEVNSTMKLNNRGNLLASLGIVPNDYNNLTLDISLENFLLPDLNIYTNYYTGHSALEGDMYYYCQTKIVDGQIESENKLLVKNATLETSDAGLYSIPLKFAFFLLTDRNGDVELDIPVSGDLNDPELNVGKIVWETFKNVIDKTVLAPVDFLVGLVGGDPKELEEMVFSYSDTIPSNKQYRQLDKLLDLERKKDGLAIIMDFYVDERLYSEAISEEMIGMEFNQSGADYQKNIEEFETFVFEKVGTDSLSLDEAIRQLTTEKNVDSVRDGRIQNLIDRVSEFLVTEHLDSEIIVQRGSDESPENLGSYPTFKITYDMLGSNQDSTSVKD